MTDKATLSFQTHFHSIELSSLELPVEVRRSNLSLAVRGRTNGTVEVDPGEYLVICRLPAGQQLISHVEVKAGERIPVDLKPSEGDASPSENLELDHFMRRQSRRAKGLSSSLPGSSDSGLPSSLMPSSSQFDLGVSISNLFAFKGENYNAAQGAMSQPILADFGNDADISVTAQSMAAAPTRLTVRWFMGNVLAKAASVINGGTILAPNNLAIDIPSEVLGGSGPIICQLHQDGQAPSNMCVPLPPAEYGLQPPKLTLLAPEPQIPRFRLDVQLQHSVANLLAHYLRGSMLSEARETVSSSTLSAQELLENKRQDPIAAAVGAYAILRVGEQAQKNELQQWSSNLMNWFPWLPDGVVIRGEQLARSGLHAEALAAFIELNNRGLPLFSQGLTFAVDRLRLYVEKSESISRQFPEDQVHNGRELLNRLKTFATFSDFERTWLTYTGWDPKSPSDAVFDQVPSPDVPVTSPVVAPPASDLQPLTTTRNPNMAGAVDKSALYYFNGINGATGQYLLPPMSAQAIAQLAKRDPAFQGTIGGVVALDPLGRHLQQLQVKSLLKQSQSFGVRFGVAPDRVETAGWGVLASQATDRLILDALRPLLNHRKAQAGRFYKEFLGDNGFRQGESKDQFLSRNGMSPGPADPTKVPYYLLIVGDPQEIPFDFQYQFDVQYAIGRIWFNSVDEFARYAESVILAESGRVRLARKAVVFGTRHDGDGATNLSADQLITPLGQQIRTRGSNKQWQVDTIVGAEATHTRLTSLLGGSETPALLFTASHGMGFPHGDSRQIGHQGALLCQDWRGLTTGQVDRGDYFAAEDVVDSAHLHGLISFNFACYGAGTPRLDDFAHQKLSPPSAIAPRPFIAALPRRLLSHPSGGALAVIGHVERAWGCSIVWQDAGAQIQGFEDAMNALMDGVPVGYALESINQRYADISSSLSQKLLAIRSGTLPDDELAIANEWTASTDARSYVIIGDPAVRLPVAAVDQPGAPRLTLGTISIPQSVPLANAATTPAGNIGLTGTSATTAASQSSTVRTDSSETQTTDREPYLKTSKTTNMNESNQFAAPPPPPVTITSSENSATVTLTVPLQITISVGIGGAQGAAAAAVATGAPSADLRHPGLTDFKVEIDSDYTNREGYDPQFLGSGSKIVPLPGLSKAQKKDVAFLTGLSDFELRYHHYSVVLNSRRRLAFFTAVNIDGKLAGRPTREPDKWIFDPRVHQSAQVGEDLYSSNPFDRGHLVRRLDPAWGRTAAAIKRANDDTFHFTNCSPQHSRFNQGQNLWAGLEDYLLDKADAEDRKMTVFTGPIFGTSDPNYRGVMIPKQYWKVAVISRANGMLTALGFIVDQEKLLHEFISFDTAAVAQTFQVPVSKIASLTGLDFGSLASVDAGNVASFAVGQSDLKPLSTFADIVLPPPISLPAVGAPDRSFATSSSTLVPPEVVNGTDLRYYLVAYDENGVERLDHPAGQITRLLDQAILDPLVTDVVLLSHGWQGDVPAAREQYSGWIRTMAANQPDRVRIRAVRPGFKPLLIGIHWPSLAWGDESLGSQSFSVTARAPIDEANGVAAALGQRSMAAAIETYVARLGDTPEAREQLRGPLRDVLLAAAAQTAEPNVLPANLSNAYRALDAALGIGGHGIGGDPASDRDPFNPDVVYQNARLMFDPGRPSDPQPFGAEPVGFAGGFFSRDTLLSPLRALTYWKMKDRARKIGEEAVHNLLVRLQQAAGTRNVRFHLVGHSFGCIVTTAAICGGPGSAPIPKPIQSLSLLQGALSLWSYTDDIPYQHGTAGYFNKMISQKLVSGPIITTRSKFDLAVGKWYPLSSRMSGSVAFDSSAFPKYGGLGSFGIQGNDLPLNPAEGVTILSTDGVYTMPTGGGILNVEASSVINQGGGFSGAHSDIRKPEVAHLVWSAMIG
ncbi:MAG: DNA/RNA non-specific endonuclease [Planctomycetota bacterium]|nr:DNA/RNA non-specific endonuclease [Planctomycetota bacterium]